MDFSLSEDQKIFRRMVRDFVIREVAPHSGRIDRNEEFPTENIRKMGELGLFGIGFPEEYGGSGGNSIHLAIATEEIARICASTAVIYLVSVATACYAIYKFGSEEQKQRFVIPQAKGEKLIAFALTEPGAGSDAAALETTATRKGDGYILNGTKLFISFGAEAGAAVVFATMDKSLRHRGITAFIVEKGTPGFSMGKKERKLGMRGAPTVELIFEDCYVPLENRLGGEGQGFRIAITALDNSRIYVAAQAVGIAQAALDLSLSYAKERQQFGQPIANFQAIQWMLADMATQVEAARLLVHQAAYLKDKGLPFVKEGSMAKVFATETAMAATTTAVQIYGGYGYTKDYPLERLFRDAKVTEIYEGTSEIQRRTIAKQLLS
jgi:acyl-CoA dehydrogenase